MPYFVVFSSRNEWVCCNLPAVTFFEHVECLKPQSRRFARRSTDRTHSWRRHEACRKGGNIETLWVKISGNRKISGHGHQVLSNIAEVIWIPLMECDGESWRLGGRLGRKMIYIRPAGLAMEGKAGKLASKQASKQASHSHPRQPADFSFLRSIVSYPCLKHPTITLTSHHESSLKSSRTRISFSYPSIPDLSFQCFEESCHDLHSHFLKWILDSATRWRKTPQTQNLIRETVEWIITPTSICGHSTKTTKRTRHTWGLG